MSPTVKTVVVATALLAVAARVPQTRQYVVPDSGGIWGWFTGLFGF